MHATMMRRLFWEAGRDFVKMWENQRYM